MASLEPIEHLRAATDRASRLLANDLKAIPEEKQNTSPGGIARTPVNIVAECAMVNGRIAHFLRSGEMPPRPTIEERNRHLASFDSAEKALAYLERETTVLLAAFDGLEPARLGERNDELFGRPMTLFQLAELAAVHMSYHDGQLNYVQTLYGDAEMHWG